MNDELEQLVDEVESKEAKERRALTLLLDKYSEPKGKVFALRSEMGFALGETGQQVRIPSFTIVQTLDWIGKEVLMGSQMDFMQNHLDEKGRLRVDESIAEEVKQRAPDWSRQAAISAYLAHDRRRKFGTIVAVLNPIWVDDPQHENWAPAAGGRRALKSGYSFSALDSRGRIGLLDLDGTRLYALDGQHRVMGIRGIQDLRDKGFLELKKVDGSKTNEPLMKEDFMKSFNLSVTDLQAILTDSMSVEIIPAVLAGETWNQASQRVRSVFITINAYAQKTGKSETTLLDESDGFAIVARKIGTLHPLFKDDRVNWKGSTLPKRTRWYTTLETLKIMATDYLGQVDEERAKRWMPMFKGQVPIRPEEEDIQSAKDTFSTFIDRINALPVFRGLENGDSLDAIRAFPGEKDLDEPARGHLLTRPIGQMILAKAVGRLVADGLDVDEIFSKLGKWDVAGGFTQHEPASIWYGVTYDFNKRNMGTRVNKDQAARLLEYMIRGADQEERAVLMKFLVESRRQGGTDDKPKWVTFEGDSETYDPEDPAHGKDLPRPIDKLPARKR